MVVHIYIYERSLKLRFLHSLDFIKYLFIKLNIVSYSERFSCNNEYKVTYDMSLINRTNPLTINSNKTQMVSFICFQLFQIPNHSYD